MKAQKTCPKCGNKVHARISKCRCGHTFYETKGKPKADKPKAEGAGPGRKQCLACGAFCGVRSAKCPSCDHDFAKAVKNPIKKEVKEEAPPPPAARTDYIPSTDKSLRIVLVPAGVPAHKPEQWTEEGLKEWALKVQEPFVDKGLVLCNDALAYWARKFYSFWKDEEKEKLVKRVFPID